MWANLLEIRRFIIFGRTFDAIIQSKKTMLYTRVKIFQASYDRCERYLSTFYIRLSLIHYSYVKL